VLVIIVNYLMTAKPCKYISSTTDLAGKELWIFLNTWNK